VGPTSKPSTVVFEITVPYSSYEIWNLATETEDPPQTRTFAKDTESRLKEDFKSSLGVFFCSCEDSQAMPWTLDEANTRWQARRVLLWGSIMRKNGPCPDSINEVRFSRSAWSAVTGRQECVVLKMLESMIVRVTRRDTVGELSFYWVQNQRGGGKTERTRRVCGALILATALKRAANARISMPLSRVLAHVLKSHKRCTDTRLLWGALAL
jgi:hypothetical protein